jgi:non-ribosomal peptide synthetase component F
VEGLLGYFVNTVMLRTHAGGDPTLREFLQRVRDTTLGAYEHQAIPFEDVIQALARQHGVQRTSLFQVMFILQNAMQRPLQLPTLTLSILPTDTLLPTTCDIVLVLNETPQGVAGRCLYKPHLFNAATIMQMFGDFQQILERLRSEPEQRLSTLRRRGRTQP